MNSLLKMKLKLEMNVEMNHDFNVEMNRKNEPEMNGELEMNLKKIVEMNEPKQLIKKKTKTLFKGDDIMKINLETVKRRVQNDTTHYIMGVKFVTTEPPEIVLNTIKKDFMIYKDITRIVVKQNMVELMVGNATLYTFYFLKKDVFDAVIPELNQFGVEVLDLNTINSKNI